MDLEQHRLQAARASGGISNDAIYNRILQLLAERSFSGKALDFGAGIGNLTRQLSGFTQVTGADILPRPAHLPPEIHWHHVDLNDGHQLPAASFDTVIAAEVIEHLENPREVAREWYRLLKPGGKLLLSTPNNESIRSLIALIVRGHFIAFDDSCYPAHITALVRKDIARVLTEAGFTKIRFDYTNSGDIPKLPFFSWQQVSGGLLKGLRFSDNLIATAAK